MTQALAVARGRIGLVDAGLDVDRGEAALPVEPSNRADRGAELGLDEERRPAASGDERPQLRPPVSPGCPLISVAAADAVLQAAVDVEHDRQRAAPSARART